MKRFGVPFFAIWALGMMGCASTPVTSGAVPTADQAIVSIKRDSVALSLDTWDIYVDNKVVAAVKNGQEMRFPLKNGKYFMFLTTALGQKSDVVTFAAESNELSFTTYLSGGLHLVQTDTKVAALPAGGGLAGATRRAGDKLIAELPQKSTVAVLNVEARNRNDSAAVLDDLQLQLFDSHQFTLVDRKRLDALDGEHRFQMSGAVSDESAVGIGNYLGAGVVITGNITGSGDARRLVLQALDVKTAQLIAMANERF